MARILVVEDSQELRDLISLVLEDEGHTVAAVRTPSDAREVIQAARYDLIVTDLTEQQADGPGVDDQAWLSEASRVARVLVLTGRAWAATSSAEQLGVDGLLAKPFEIDILLDRISQLIPSRE